MMMMIVGVIYFYDFSKLGRIFNFELEQEICHHFKVEFQTQFYGNDFIFKDP